jgi:hypothetical protein
MKPTDNDVHSSPDSVEAALDRFWKCKDLAGNVPDYVGFEIWISEKIEAARSATIPLHMQSGRGTEILLVLELIAAAENAGLEITREGLRPRRDKFKPDGKRLRLKPFNRIKLLLSFFNDLPERQRDLYFGLSKISRQANATSSVNQDASQLEHRVAFFDAVNAKDAALAFKMLGRLREEAHDSGELEFLEATAFFHDNRLKDAIEHASKVSREDIDWSRAAMLILESHALQGNIDAINLQSGLSLPRYFLPYLCQVAVANSSDPEASAERAVKLISGVPDISQGSGVFQTWNRHSCQIAVQSIELKQLLALQRLATEQGGGENIAEESDAQTPLRMRQIEFAVALDPDMIQRLSACELEDAYREIVKRLINYGSADQTDYIQALTTQWRIGDRAVFLDNMLANLGLLISGNPKNEIWQLDRYRARNTNFVPV